MKTLNILLVCFFVMFLLFGCSSKKIDESNPQDLVNDAEDDISSKRYIVALDKLKAVKNKFPYSHLATQAKLRIADVYYLEEAFVESAAAYESFRDLHPKHEKADYVIFRIAESYFNQLPSTEDRDLTAANKAIEAYKELINLYPKSTFIDTASKHLKESFDRIVEKEFYIAEFYFVRKMYDSAVPRYEKITTNYPGTSLEQNAYWNLSRSLQALDRKDEAKHILKTYIERYPNGIYANKAAKWIDDNQVQ